MFSKFEEPRKFSVLESQILYDPNNSYKNELVKINQFVKEDFAPMMMKGVRFSMKGYIDQTWMENIPLYCAGTYTHRLVDKKTNGS